eukprot:GILI01024332.1.p1 GENE.GILI01024332.1~~GILI01024332.1.p1  ORF type:complete len:320 (+),score=49.07 GILI01024332.1:37-960(+)
MSTDPLPLPAPEQPWVRPGVMTPCGTHVIQHGPENGPVVICVHGIGSYYFHFDWIVPALVGAGFRVVVYDLIGRGFSQPSDSYTDVAHVEQLRRVVQFIGSPQQYHLVAHSMGGVIACLYTEKYPTEVADLVLLAPAGLMNSGLIKFVRFMKCLHGMVRSNMLQGQETAWRADIHTKNAQTKVIEDDMVAKLHLASRNNPYQYDSFFKSLLVFPFWGLERSIAKITSTSRRVLLLWGDRDISVPFSPCYARWVRQLSRRDIKAHVEHEVYKNTGHSFFLEKSDECRSRVVGFLTSSTSSSGSSANQL